MPTNRERLEEAMLNRAHVVCHVPLQPFCLWHMLNLRRIHSPLLYGSKASRPDLLAAVAICASTIATPPAMLKPKLPKLPWATELELKKFAVYKGDFHQPPAMLDSEGKQLGAVWELAVVARLMHLTRLDWNEAWMFPQWAQLSPALVEAAGGDPGLISEADERALAKAYPDDKEDSHAG